MNNRRTYLGCDCSSPDHLAVLDLDRDDGLVTISVLMNNHLPWWRRLVVAFRYVFRIRVPDTHWGSYHFDTVLLSKQDVLGLDDFIQESKGVV